MTNEVVEARIARCLAEHVASDTRKCVAVRIDAIEFWEMSRRLNAKIEKVDGTQGIEDDNLFVRLHTPAGTVRALPEQRELNRGRIDLIVEDVIRGEEGRVKITDDDVAEINKRVDEVEREHAEREKGRGE